MILRVRIIGAGTRDDPFRVPLPTYWQIGDEITIGPNRFMDVEIPDEDVGPLDGLPATGPQTPRGRVVVAIPPAVLSRWKEHLNNRYQENRGKYDPTPP